MANLDEPIAIVGLAMRLPGDVHSTDDFWDMLVNKRDGCMPVPTTRYNAEGFFDPSTQPNSGNFLHEDPAYFDAAFFSISPREATRLDPQQRMLLEVVWECLEDAGETNWRGSDIGCYVGVFGEDWLELNLRSAQKPDRYQIFGTGGFALSNRLSYEFDLRGPSMTIQTACSSSLVGLHEACQALKLNHCSAAIVAGTNLICAPTTTSLMVSVGVLSQSGHSQTFDAHADGYGRGEAVNVIYIKRLRDALKDGDNIRAVIRSTAVNCDGKTVGVTQPSSEAQEALIRTAYRHAGLTDQWHQTALFECHGTGTVVGDSMETTAIARVIGAQEMIVGSVKPNVGHSEGASGLTSIIKAVMSLERGTIAPNAHFHTLNPDISTNLRVPTDAMPWPKDRQHRVSVNSFGVGGTNAHAILDAATGFAPARTTEHTNQNTSHLIITSAKNTDSLRKRISSLTGYVNKYLASVADIAYTLGRRREHLPHMAFAIAHPGIPLEASSFEVCQGRLVSPHVTFVFTGQGAQWAGMGRELLETEPAFGAVVEDMDQVLRGLPIPPQWSIKEELSRDPMLSRINEVEIAQPLCTAIQVGLCAVLAAKGLRPDSVVGHSSGELAAAYAAGAITAKCAIIAAFYRGKFACSQDGLGAMAAVGLGRGEAAKYLKEGVIVACENSPHNVTISGDKEVVDDVLQRIKTESPDTFCRRLRVGVAYHSPHMSRVASEYERAITPYISPNDKMLPMFSSLSGQLVTDPVHLDAKYWSANLESPVLFSQAVQNMLVEHPEEQIFIEVGPHSALAAPLREIFRSIPSGHTPTYIPTLIRNDDDCRSLLLTTMGRALGRGVKLDMSRIMAPGIVMADLPRYPWQHEKRYWHEGRSCWQWRQQPTLPHELLGSPLPEASDLEPSWRNILRPHDVPWLADHVVDGQVTFPGAGYIAMAGEGIQQLHADPSGEGGYSIRNIQFKSPLVLNRDQEIEILTNFRPLEVADGVPSGWYKFAISAHGASGWMTHCEGQVRAGFEHPPQAKSIDPLPRSLSSGRWYRALAKNGMEFGDSFQGLEDISADPMRPAAVGTVTDRGDSHTSRYVIHPTAIDQCIHLVGISIISGSLQGTPSRYLPAMIENLYISRGASRIHVAATSRPATRGYHGDLTGMAGEDVAITIGGLFLLDIGAPEGPEHPVRLVSWTEVKPDIDFVPPKHLLAPPVLSNTVLSQKKLTDVMCNLFILAIANRIRGTNSDNPDLMIWKAFILQQEDIYRTQKSPLMLELEDWIMNTQLQDPCIQVTQARLRAVISNDDKTIAPTKYPALQNLSSTKLEEVIVQLATEIMPHLGDYAPAIMGLKLVLENGVNFLNGTLSPTDILIGDTGPIPEQLYELGVLHADWGGFLPLLSHSNPTLRVLEIGAGTGSATRAVLNHLKSTTADPLYARYVFSDISADCLVRARERFQQEDNFECVALDICSDPVEQGFEPTSFDLVVVSNAIPANPSLRIWLENIKKLMAPKARLLLHENTEAMSFLKPILGTISGWWVGEHGTTLQAQWDSELRAAGLTGIDSIASDPTGSITILSSLPYHPERSPAVTILAAAHSQDSLFTQTVAKRFHEGRYDVQYSSLDQPPPKDQQMVVSLLDEGAAYLRGLSEATFASLQKYLLEAEGARLLWVTETTEPACVDPNFGAIHGLARTLRSEIGLDISVLQVDSWDASAAQAVVDVAQKVNASRQLADTDLDYEFVFTSGKIQVPRLHWSILSQELSYVPSAQNERMLSIGCLGRLDTLQWVPSPAMPAALGAGEVEVKIEYVGLNFRDLLVLQGLVGKTDECGVEATGTVCQVGSDVTGLQVGDQISMIGAGLCQTRVRADQKIVRKLPLGLSLQDGAAMGVVYMTAMYSLIDIGNLRKGQSVLIHCAAGGVGIASINICRMIGAEIYATVGSEEKANYLVRAFGIPRHRIFNSRDNSFLPGVMKATNGRGTDIVLNSLAGNLLHASWECVAPYGKMIELGKRDFLTHGVLSMSPFLANRSFVGLDLSSLLKDRPDIAERSHKTFCHAWLQGFIKPIKPLQVFEAENMSNALRSLQTGSHMGKLVLRIPSKEPESLPCPSIQAVPSFSPDRSYLLVGGLGGIGQAVSTWMVKYGAQSIVYLSRNAGEGEGHQAFIHELELQGCHVTCVKGSVTNLAHVEEAVSSCRNPLAGVIQMAMDLKDRTFSQMTYEEWTTACGPKVTGTWNLHHTVKTLDLDFFVMFGSASGTVGMGGQTNYAAANTFIDAFARYRRQNGLAGSVLNPALVEEIGPASEHPELVERARRSHWLVLSETDVLDSLHLAIRNSKGPPATTRSSFSIGIGSTEAIETSTARFQWGRDARFGQYKSLQGKPSSTRTHRSEDRLRAILDRVGREPTLLNQDEVVTCVKAELVATITDEIAAGEEMDEEQRKSVVIDSLIAIEIRTSVRRACKVDIPTAEISKAGTVGELSVLFIRHARLKYNLDEEVDMRGV
ncbi:hypothetical protein FE257_003073 [Aspergillus nanangensis]|uniref:Carrier domain-containing protein n=1 Tax=Aspergillus nanangensis TaxID=2582783 RepID=A0AAD4CC09_ASPNN|nr:hypothetical protein FE257_003073 [Aspergillus nanangensis]